MKFELTTKQLQLLVIACIDRSVHKNPKDDWNAIYSGMTDVFGDLNRMCNANNGYKVTVEVTA